MARIDFVRSLYMKDVPIDEFKFDQLQAYSLLTYLNPAAIYQLNKIATKPSYTSSSEN